MSLNCGVCGLMCEEEKSSVRCSGGCEHSFHSKCIKNEGVKTRTGGKEWKCDTCTQKKDTSSSTSSSKSSSTSITKDFLLSTMDSFKREVFTEIKNYTSQIEEFRKAVQFLSDKVDESNTLIADIRKEYSEIKKENEIIKIENRKLNEKVYVLEDKVRSMEQYSRRTNIEISGIPETKGENVFSLLKDVGSAVGVELQESQVSAVHRIPTFKKERPPSIVVQFQTKIQRDAWITCFRRKGTLTASEVHPSFSKNRVFISEHLSPDNKIFLSQLKEKGRDAGFKYIWFREGRFFVRKNDGEKCHKISNLQDLDKL